MKSFGAIHVSMTATVRLGARPADKAAAIREVGQLLEAVGCVEPGYGQSMGKREAVANTFLGNGVAIPHGLGEDRNLVRRDGIAVLQIPAGVEWNPGQTARLVVGIAASSDGHIAILRRLTRLMQDVDLLDTLAVTTDATQIRFALENDPDLAVPGKAAVAVDLEHSTEWILDYPAGLHARPASVWAKAAQASIAPIQIRHGDDAVDARNLIALLQIGLRCGDKVLLSSADAGAVRAFKKVIAALSNQEKADAARAAAKRLSPAGGWYPPSGAEALFGVAASPGLAIGSVHQLSNLEAAVPDNPVALRDGAVVLHDALVSTKQEMRALIDKAGRRLGPADAAIFSAQAALLDDTDIITLTCQLLVAGHGVAWAWNEAIHRIAGKLSALGNPVLAERAADLLDIGHRVLRKIDPALAANTLAELPDGPLILIASDLSPSDTAGIDTLKVAGFATALGGPSAHTAILARTLGLPAMVAGGADLLARGSSGSLAILDGDNGRLYLQPSDEDLTSARAWIADTERKRADEKAQRNLPARTVDGYQITVAANVNSPDQVAFAIAQGGEGVGLMRTEFLFLERGETPTEDEQFEVYRGMIEALDGRPLIARALDIGGDKQVAHLDLAREDNPFLGVRGARLLLRRADLLDPQLRALYRTAKTGGAVSIMFPMITSVTEVLALRQRCEAIRAELNAPDLPIGIMIEVPAAAVLADKLAAHVDFFSIGTNDLTQYTLAIDRQNPELAEEADSLHPSVLRLIATTVAGAARHGRWVGVCGGVAGDPFGALLLAGLGVTELSMTPRELPAVKAMLRSSNMTALREVAARALDAETAADVRQLRLTLQ